MDPIPPLAFVEHTETNYHVRMSFLDRTAKLYFEVFFHYC